MECSECAVVGNCACETCPDCGDTGPNIITCPNCNECENCCECEICGNCGVRRRSTCGDCYLCYDCCHCGDEDEYDDEDEDRTEAVEFFETRTLHFHKAAKHELAVNACKRFLSCELEISAAEEVCSNPITATVRRWGGSIAEDGSLDSGGFEVRTAPANGDLFVRQINELGQAFDEQSAEVDTSCGFHVHADARDFNYWDVRKLLFLYQRLEPSLFAVVPRSRQNNQYCRRCGDRLAEGLALSSRKVKTFIVEKLYPDVKYSEGSNRKSALRRCKSNLRPDCRYDALNLHSWLYRGTIECRLAAGTTNPTKIINWATLWGGILDFAQTKTETTIKKLPADSWEALLQVAPSDGVRQWLTSRREKFKTNRED